MADIGRRWSPARGRRALAARPARGRRSRALAAADAARGPLASRVAERRTVVRCQPPAARRLTQAPGRRSSARARAAERAAPHGSPPRPRRRDGGRQAAASRTTHRRTLTLVVDAVAYHLPGRTASGLPVGPGVVAVDPTVIPLGTRDVRPGLRAGGRRRRRRRRSRAHDRPLVPRDGRRRAPGAAAPSRSRCTLARAATTRWHRGARGAGRCSPSASAAIAAAAAAPSPCGRDTLASAARLARARSRRASTCAHVAPRGRPPHGRSCSSPQLAGLALAPASTEKLAVAYAALVVLGPGTVPHRDDWPPVGWRAATWRGDLFLRATAIRPSRAGRPGVAGGAGAGWGIRRDPGRVLGDESFFDRERTAPGWRASFLGDESPPLSALVVERAEGWPALSTGLLAGEPLSAARAPRRRGRAAAPAWRHGARGAPSRCARRPAPSRCRASSGR